MIQWKKENMYVLFISLYICMGVVHIVVTIYLQRTSQDKQRGTPFCGHSYISSESSLNTKGFTTKWQTKKQETDKNILLVHIISTKLSNIHTLFNV